jgi:hypothetical protein
MTGRDFVSELERKGFVVRRRSRTFVWVARGEQTLMLDEEADVPDTFVLRILAHSMPPASARRAVAHASVRPARISGRPPASPSARPSRLP